MTPDEGSESVPVRRVSVLGRLVPAFSYAVPAPACIVSALLLIASMHAFKNAEAAGLVSVSGGIVEANLPVRITLVFAISVGFVGIIITLVRLFGETTTASPSALFFLVTGCVGLAPLVLLWKAELLLIQGIATGGRGVVTAESTIQRWLTLTVVFAIFADLILVVASVVPLPAALRAKRGYAPLVLLILMELALIGMAVAFQTRTSWLQHLRFGERF